MSSVRLVPTTTVPQSLSFFRGRVGYMKAKEIEVHAVCRRLRISGRLASEKA